MADRLNELHRERGDLKLQGRVRDMVPVQKAIIAEAEKIGRVRDLANAWNYLERGDHGLNFWVGYALSHGKPFGITEWASTWFSDGHAGGDNPFFIDKMLDYIADPAHHVARSFYFNSGNTPGVSHDITSATTKFPRALAELRRRASLL